MVAFQITVKSGTDQFHSFLHQSGVLADTKPTDRCFVIIPSKRVLAGRFAILLQKNGVQCRALGHGAGHVTDSRGVRRRVQGILVLCVPEKDARKTELYAKLFGVAYIPVAHHE